MDVDFVIAVIKRIRKRAFNLNLNFFARVLNSYSDKKLRE